MILDSYFCSSAIGSCRNITKQSTDVRLPSTVINCSRRQSTAVDGYRLPSTVVNCHRLTSTVINCRRPAFDRENQTACESLALPHSTLHTPWDNIILPSPIKSNLLGYAESALLFSQAQVSPHIISWNRLILLYGPPGTGKTSLCRALAHKLAIRTLHIFNQGAFLLEIKIHSLFSKWFSESGFPNFFNEFGKLFRMNLIVYFDEVERGRRQLITVDGRIR